MSTDVIPHRMGPIMAAAIIAMALISVTVLSFPIAQDSDGETDAFTVTLLKYESFVLKDGTGEESSVIPSERGIYTFDEPTTVYVAYRNAVSDRELKGIIIDGGSMSTMLPITVDRDMTVLPVEVLKGYTVSTEGAFGTKLYIATPDERTGTYTASIEIRNGGGTVDVAAHVAGIAIKQWGWNGNTLIIEMEDHIGYRGTIPATMTIHNGNSIQWFKVFLFIAGPLVDSDSP